MNKVMLSLALGVCLVAIWAGCTIHSSQSDPDIHPESPVLYRGLWSADSYYEFTHQSLSGTEGARIALRNPNSAASGHFNTQLGHTITFSAMQNSGSIHGQGQIEGPIYIDIHWETACVTVERNRATVAGEITSIDLGDNPFEIPLEVGWIFYFAVEDNGEGANAPADRHHSNVFWGMPGFGVFCNVLHPDNAVIWPEDLWLEIDGDGQIQVQ